METVQIVKKHIRHLYFHGKFLFRDNDAGNMNITDP